MVFGAGAPTSLRMLMDTHVRYSVATMLRL